MDMASVKDFNFLIYCHYPYHSILFEIYCLCCGYMWNKIIL